MNLVTSFSIQYFRYNLYVSKFDLKFIYSIENVLWNQLIDSKLLILEIILSIKS